MSLWSLFTFLMAGCGESPLLNHRDEISVPAANERAAPASTPSTAPARICSFEFPKADLCATMEWTKPPTVGVDSPLTLQFWDRSSKQNRAPAADVQVRLLMPSMGHGGLGKPRTKKLDAPEIGKYFVDTVVFTMGGQWEIHVKLLTGAEVLEAAKTSLELHEDS